MDRCCKQGHLRFVLFCFYKKAHLLEIPEAGCINIKIIQKEAEPNLGFGDLVH